MSTEVTSWIHIWIPLKNDNEEKRGSTFQVSYVPEDEINSAPKNLSEEEEDADSVVLGGRESSEYRIKYFLQHDLKNSRYTTKPSEDGKFILYSFQVKSSDVESILIQLTRRGIGTDEDTSVSVVPEQINLGSRLSVTASRNTLNADAGAEDSTSSGLVGPKFYQTVKSRLMVTEVISRIRAGGSFTFDYCMLVILAGMIAFMGLIDNSSVTLVASMLVSPIMGPILAGIFGFVIQDRSLILKGVRNEVVSLLMCIFIGMVLSIFVSLMILHDVYGLIDVSQWPSNEMLSRGRTKCLITGIFVAIPSGAGIALSVLGGNAGSLVGVAISASLLPPAVNAGVFWSFAILAAIYNGDDRDLIRGFDGIVSHQSLGCPPPIIGVNSSEIGSNFMLYYHCDLAVDAFVSGTVSLTLTILNIICIIFTGFAILRIKEVTPDKIPQTFSNFWKKDIKAHRHYYNTVKNMNQVRDPIEKDEADHTIGLLDGTFLQKIINQAHNDQEYLDITRWVAIPQPPPVRNEERKEEIDVKALENIFEIAVEEEKKRSSLTYEEIIGQAVKDGRKYSQRFDRQFSI